MKKFLLAFALLLSLVQPAFATDNDLETGQVENDSLRIRVWDTDDNEWHYVLGCGW